jgi:hypothetical protein
MECMEDCNTTRTAPLTTMPCLDTQHPAVPWDHIYGSSHSRITHALAHSNFPRPMAHSAPTRSGQAQSWLVVLLLGRVLGSASTVDSSS